VGDEFDVQQVRKDASGQRIRVLDPATGIELSPPTDVIGRVRVSEVSLNSNVATVRTVQGDAMMFEHGDGVTRVGSAMAGASTREPGFGARPQHSDTLKLGVQRSADNAARVAVSEFEIVGLSDGQTVNQLQELIARSLTRRLSGDRRYQVVNRQDLDRIQDEFDLSLEVRGELPSGQRAPVSIAGYIVSGVVEIDEDEVRRTISLRGESRDLPSIFELRASGEVSIVDTRAEIIAAEQVLITQRVRSSDLGEAGPRGALADEFSKTAASLLRSTLYPLRVVQIQEGSGNFVINGGIDSGLEVGATLNAYAIGAPVIDFDTGIELAPGSRTLVGTLTVIDVTDQISTAEASVLDAELKVGSLVEVTQRPAAARPAATTPSASTNNANPKTSTEDEIDVPF
ncbi:MAG: hypothetical protein AAFO63_14270, partial [Pseudomonadota bacterium]